MDGDFRNGPEAYYDTLLDVTWLTDATASGNLTYGQARAWLRQVAVGSVAGWRFPDGEGRELQSLFRVTLGLIDNGPMDPIDFRKANTGPFKNLEHASEVWIMSDDPYRPWAEPDYPSYWLSTYYGVGQGGADIYSKMPTWAVLSGDVPVVPEPATSVLFALGAGALALRLKLRKRSPAEGRTLR
ncbi:MAG: PEP-CTERM sorting domain-containing protein [Comamonadaceae bacterium]|nr:PEP-CTERM sorting domain-containing protein [Comamonadaceae bacterium]